MPLPKPISYPASLTRTQWKKDKSLFAAKTGVGKRLEELEKMQASLSCANLLALGDSSLTPDKAAEAGKQCSAELTSLANVNRKVKEFVDFMDGEIKKAVADKTFPAGTRKLMESMRIAADKLHKDLIKRWHELSSKAKEVDSALTRVKAEFEKRQKTVVDKAIEAEAMGRFVAKTLTSMLVEAKSLGKTLSASKDPRVMVKVQHELSLLEVRLKNLGGGAGVEEWKSTVGAHRKWLADQPFKLPLPAVCSADREAEVVKVGKQCVALRNELQGILKELSL